MKKIIIAIPESVQIVDALGLAMIAGKKKEVVSQYFFLQTTKELVSICLN